MSINKNMQELRVNGYSIINEVYSANEIASLSICIENYKSSKDLVVNKDVFAIRQLIKVVPELKHKIFNEKLKTILDSLFKSDHFLTKAIYFDKPPESNWSVPYHQDLSISVNKKISLNGYDNWTFKKGLYGVQPPTPILESTFTIRIHLDDTTRDNGALRVNS